MRPLLFVTCVALLSCSTACSELTSSARALPLSQSPSYPLDGLPRSVGDGEKLACETGEIELTAYRGDHVRYRKPVRVHPAFKAQLQAFEAIVAELGRTHFGRAPRAIAHFGAYVCRPMRGHARWVSEHALGNALDVAGFDFGPLPKKSPGFHQLPLALQKSFSVRVDKDWHAKNQDDAKSVFLHALTDRLIARPDVFRSLVGPDYPGHHNHLHLAHPPYRMVKLGDLQRWWFW